MGRLASCPLHSEAVEINPRALQQQLIASRDVRRVDVQQRWERQGAHRQGILLLSWHEERSRIDALNPTRPIVVYCHHGIRSDDATVFLRSIGFPRVKSLQGRIDRWSEDIDPTLPRY